jgi:hypothetical protein
MMPAPLEQKIEQKTNSNAIYQAYQSDAPARAGVSASGAALCPLAIRPNSGTIHAAPNP